MMAKGKKCPQCGYYMYALEEKIEPAGKWVIYQCRATECSFKEKVFEDSTELQNSYSNINIRNKNSTIMQRGIDGQIELLQQMKSFLEGLSEQFDDINRNKQRFLNNLDSEGLDIKLLQRFEEYFQENRHKTNELIDKIESEDIPYTEQVIRYLEETPR